VQRVLSVTYFDRLWPASLILLGALATAIALSAGSLGFSGQQGFGANKFALAMSGCAVLLTGIVRQVPAAWRRVGEWLLVGAAALAAAFASDLVVVNGLPGFAAKLGLLVAVGLSLVVSGVAEIPFVRRRETASQAGSAVVDWKLLSQFLAVGVQFGLLVLAVRQFHLENQAFYHNVMFLAFFGFLLHYCLPLRYRLWFFILLSVAALGGILGLVNTAWLLGIGLALIGLCHLPISYHGRVGALLAAGAVLVALRAAWIDGSWLDVIWPILASMFMFRLIIYVYDLQHSKTTPTLASTLSYFFLLPNIVFPFFPVVDYSTFRRTYFDGEPHRIYQKGLDWVLRGILQLIAYRFINYYVVISPQEVTDAATLVRYVVANLALYVRISGQFHLIIGLLHLYGFNLPEANRLYFLATSFTDLWRRINIYWKDFMMKVFYYPTYFRIKRWGPTFSLIAATLFVFFVTWFLHAYQWFWLRGSFLLTAPDVVFWLILAILVVVNTLHEARRSRKRTLGQQTLTVRDIAGQAVRAAGTFTLLAVLWALWNSASIRDWIGLLAVVDAGPADISVLVLSFAAIAGVFGLSLWVTARLNERAGSEAQPAAFFRAAGVTGGLALLLLALGAPVVQNRLGASPAALIADLTVNRLSDREAGLLQQGYYEDLVGVNRFNSQLWEIYTKRPSDWVAIRHTAAMRTTNDNLIVEFVPSTTIDFNGTRITINRWGMRDRDYTLAPPPNTYRIALTGPSFVMGLGVEDNEGFEWLLEDQLNWEHAGEPYARYEILDFAVPGYSPLQDLIVFEQKALSFQPNAIFYMGHQREEESVVGYLADRLSVGAELPYEDMMAFANAAGIEPGTSKDEAIRRLTPLGGQILLRTYQHIVEASHAHNVLPVWIFMPTLEDPVHEAEVTHLSGLANEAGFVTLDLSDAYANQDVDSLVVAYWDKHPNAKGHRLIADYLYRALQEKQNEIPLFN
jgi:hypothetical protein